MNGLLGVLLGWSAIPVIVVALILQAALFGFGGFAVLGANVLIMGLPAVAAYYFSAHLLYRRPLVAGVIAAFIGVSGAAIVASVLLFASGGMFLLTLSTCCLSCMCQLCSLKRPLRLWLCRPC
ncbi:energy-coupling factor ABC transporter permease [Paenalcaligenes niemegkensis]|nr:energy-coupling factor ABC transporter permease [Paenalcaligenes niemegkensis]MCQ9617578.1 energy-coupling factor ABC transporter permease [Paenalcaligenes niemegkensis]